jgi:hypothetical protein
MVVTRPKETFLTKWPVFPLSREEARATPKDTLKAVLVPKFWCQGVLAKLSRAQTRQAGCHGLESRGTRVMAAYICKACEIEGQDFEASPGRVVCWNCHDEAMVTARIVTEGL